MQLYCPLPSQSTAVLGAVRMNLPPPKKLHSLRQDGQRHAGDDKEITELATHHPR